jgi:peptidyl-prolyl cis-trans isomerase SurA
VKVIRSVALASLMLLGAGAAHAQTKPKSEMLDGIAAVVNDEVVLRSDVEEQLYLFLLRNQMPTDSAVVDTLRDQILEQMIEEKLIVAEAKRQGVTVSDADVNKEVDEALRSAKERLGADYAEQLRRENMTEEKLRDKYRSEVRRQLLAQRLVQKQFVRKSPTQAEAETYFKAHKAKFPRVPAEVRVSVIQIPVEPDSAASSQAKGKATAARKRILAGEKFAKVAAELSEDQSSARSGGDLGFIGRGSMDPAFEKAVFEANTGQVSEPLRTGYGWHLLEVLERDTVKTRAGRDSLDREGRPALEAHVRHILIRVPVTDADIEKARKSAVRVREQATKGADFTSLVKRYSKYQGSKSEDGDLGFLSLGTLQPAIRAGLDSLEVGKVSEPLPNPAGFNIFKVTDRKPEREYTLEEIKDELPEVVAQMQFRDRYQEWVKGLRAKAHIEIRKS